MPVVVPEDWPDWPQDGLEQLGQCPVCGSEERIVWHKDLIDRWFHAPGRWIMQRCMQCESGYIDPRPNRESIGLAYARYETHRPNELNSRSEARLSTRLRNGYLNAKYGYRMQPAARWGYCAMHLLPPPLRWEWDHYARHLPRPEPGRNRLLDVGCGNGEFLVRARWQGWDVYGIDQDEVALSHARDAGIPVTHGPVEVGQFAPESFDAITSHQVIEHVDSPPAFLQALFTWLKPGGRVWLGTPNAASTLHREFGADWYDLHPPQHLVIFSPRALLAALSHTGFERAELLRRGYVDSHLHSLSVKARETREVGDWTLLAKGCRQTAPVAKQLLLEAGAWLDPGKCSDLVAIAWKPAS